MHGQSRGESTLAGHAERRLMRGYLACWRASQQSHMAYWMVARSVYSYIAILGTTVRICRRQSGLQQSSRSTGASPAPWKIC
jgi:hypothetical protein